MPDGHFWQHSGNKCTGEPKYVSCLSQVKMGEIFRVVRVEPSEPVSIRPWFYSICG